MEMIKKEYDDIVSFDDKREFVNITFNKSIGTLEFIVDSGNDLVGFSLSSGNIRDLHETLKEYFNRIDNK